MMERREEIGLRFGLGLGWRRDGSQMRKWFTPLLSQGDAKVLNFFFFWLYQKPS